MDNKKPIGFVVKSLSRVIGRRADNSSGRQYLESLTGTNGWIIGYLAHNSDKKICQRDIEEHFSVRRSTVSRVMSLMEQKGLVSRVSVDGDARLKQLVLTDKALEIHGMIEADLDKMESDLVEGIPEKDLEVFRRVAEKMMDNIGGVKCHERGGSETK